MTKLLHALLLASAVAAGCLAAEPKEAEPKAAEPAADPALQTPQAKGLYALGMEIGTSLKDLGIKDGLDAFFMGVTDAVKGNKPRLADAEAGKARNALIAQAQERRKKEMAAMGNEAKKKGEDFLVANGRQEGVVTTKSGLQYTIMKKAEGPMPKATDKVTVHYRGTLLNGTEFDSSYKRNQPATFPLNGVIKGWTEGVQLMSPGSKFKFFIPSGLAYGERGAPPTIPPNSTLIFEVELLSIGEPQK